MKKINLFYKMDELKIHEEAKKLSRFSYGTLYERLNDIANDMVDVDNKKLFMWASENSGLVNDYVYNQEISNIRDYKLYFDIVNLIASTQTEYYTEELIKESENILRYIVYEYISIKYGEIITEEQFEKLENEIPFDGDDCFLEDVFETVNNIMEKEE